MLLQQTGLLYTTPSGSSSASYITTNDATSASAVYTVNVGTLAAGKYAIGVAGVGNAGIATACTIDSVTADSRGTGYTSDQNSAAWFDATITGGASIDVVCTHAAAFANSVVFIFNVDGLTFQVANGDGENNGSINCNVNTLSGDSILAIGNNNSGAQTWTGVTNVATGGAGNCSAALNSNATGGTPETVTFDYSAFTRGAAEAVVYR